MNMLLKLAAAAHIAAMGSMILSDPARACIATVTISNPSALYASPNSDYVLYHLGPPAIVCLVEVVPGAHPAGVHFIIMGQQHGGYMDNVSEPEMIPQPALQ